MSTDEIATLADLVEDLGVADLSRIWLQPCPGAATVDDVQTWRRYYNRPFELVSSTLVEKPLELPQACLALGRALDAFVRQADLGVVCWGNGPFQLDEETVRVPAAAFVSWQRLPERRIPTVPIPAVVPDLVVEWVTARQTAEERTRRRSDYGRAGVRLIWEIDPETSTGILYTEHKEGPTATELTGGEVLPGFSISLATILPPALVDSPAS